MGTFSMLSCSADPVAGLLICVWVGEVDTDEDYARSLDLIRAGDAAAIEHRVPYVCIVDVSKESPQPPAIWRKRISETHSAVASDPYYFALVAPNAIVRGVFTAISWLVTIRNPRHRATAASTFLGAAAWVREVSGRSYPMLEVLHYQAKQRALAGSKSVRPTEPGS